MRVAASVPKYPPHSRVGAWLTTHDLLAHADVDATVVTTRSRGGAPYDLDGVKVVPFSARNLSDAVVASDVVVAHLGDDGHGAMWAARHDKPLLRMVHSMPDDKVNASDLTGAAHAVFPSEACRDAYGWDGPSTVIHPPVDPSQHHTTTGDRATIVNLAAEKGGDLFWRLAARMPDSAFLGVCGGWGKQVLPAAAEMALLAGTPEAGPNVHVVAQQVDMRTVWRQTRVLLVPSAEESYGRVAVEARCSGIPVVAHPSPGLQEACPTARWVHRDDIDGWVDAIRSAQPSAPTWPDPNPGRAAFRAALRSVVPLVAA